MRSWTGSPLADKLTDNSRGDVKWFPEGQGKLPRQISRKHSDSDGHSYKKYPGLKIEQ